jgi:hypothetical protein
MSVLELKQEIRKLNSQELAELQAFIADMEAVNFDERLEADSAAGNFFDLEQRLQAKIAAGEWKDL